jgi:hypothetical protein
MCTTGGPPVLPKEVWMIVVEHLGPIMELLNLCSVFLMKPAENDLLLSHWLRTQRVSTHIELPESQTAWLLTNRIQGKLWWTMLGETYLTASSTYQGARVTDV